MMKFISIATNAIFWPVTVHAKGFGISTFDSALSWIDKIGPLALPVALAAEVGTNTKAIVNLRILFQALANGETASIENSAEILYWAMREPRTQTYHDIGVKIGLLPTGLVDNVAGYYMYIEDAVAMTVHNLKVNFGYGTLTSATFDANAIDMEGVQKMITNADGIVRAGKAVHDGLHDFARQDLRTGSKIARTIFRWKE